MRQPARYAEAEAPEHRPPDSQDRRAAKAGARQAVARARQHAKYRQLPDRLPPHLQPAARCAGCGGTLAHGQDTHHPGCADQPSEPEQETA